MANHFTYTKGIVHKTVLHDAIVETATSSAISIAGVRGVGIQITATGITTRSTVLTITVSMDGGTTYQAYSRLVSNATNTNVQNVTRVASVTQGATGTTIFWLDPTTLAGLTHFKAVATITDSGSPAGTVTVTAVKTY